MFSFHTVRTENPHTPQTHPSASNFYEYHSDILQTPPRQPRGISKEHNIPTDTNRHKQTQTDTSRHRQVLFEYVWHLSLGICCRLLACHVPRRRLGVSGGCLGGVWGISEWYLWKLEALGCAWGVCGFSVLKVWSKNTI